MKSIRLESQLRTAFLLGPLAGAVALCWGCISDPDTSGLGSSDAGSRDGAAPGTDGGRAEAGPDDAGAEAGSDATSLPPVDAGGPTGTVVGTVLDFEQGPGRGVLPGARVSVVGASPAIEAVTDKSGAFVLSNVPAADRVLLSISHETDKVSHVTYGSSQLVVPVVAGRTVMVEGFVHEGCYATVNVSSVTQDTKKLLQEGCATRSGAYASLTIPDNQTLLLPTGAVFGQTARVELIPAAFPLVDTNGKLDLSGSVGLPGDLGGVSGGTAAPIDMVGGAEVRIVDDATGTPLHVAPGHHVALGLPVHRRAADAEAFGAWAYDATQGRWVEDTTATLGTFTTDVPPQSEQVIEIYTVQVTSLAWWGVAHARAPGGCVRGTLTAGGIPAAGVYVRGSGVDYFGSGGAVSANDGSFCVDGKALASMQVLGAYVPPAGSPYAGTSAPVAVGAAGRSCGTDATKCTDLGVLTLDPLLPSCATGAVKRTVADGGATPVAIALDVTLQNLPVTLAQMNTGIRGSAYIGQVTPAVDGRVCAAVAPGTTVNLRDSTGTVCAGVGTNPGAIAEIPPGDAGLNACGTAGCFDAGDLFYGCS